MAAAKTAGLAAALTAGFVLLAGGAATASGLPSPVASATPAPKPAESHPAESHPASPKAAGSRAVPNPTAPATAAGPAAPSAGAPPAGAPADPAAVTPDAAQAARQAALVDQEDQRLIQIRAALAAMLQIGGRESAMWKRPQIFGSSHGKTLVLPERGTEEPYTIEDLRAVAGGRYVHRLADGSYVLGVHVFVADGAELLLESGSQPLTIRMGSIPGAFGSIVGFGGTITIKGVAGRPVRILSWNPATGRPDTDVTDGRAYIRAVGGEFTMDHAQVQHLGFWSGRTGGIALTGTDRPASAAKHRSKEQRHADKRERLRQQEAGQGAGGGAGDVQVDPAGEAGQGGTADGTASHVPAEDLVTGLIRDSIIDGNAYGAFISGSNQTQIVRNVIRGSLVNGVLMHRFAKNATIEHTTVTGSGGDGFVLSRATEKVRVIECVAENNGRNGFTLNGQALAEGPSASGESLERFGDSSVNRSRATDNRRYGIELLGGDRLAVQSSRVTGGDMGIVVRAGATGVHLSGNTVTGQARHGIALRDGVTGADVAGNTVTGAPAGIYLRDSSGTVVGNTIRTARVAGAHGVVLRGEVGGSRVTSNTISGAGTSAVRTSGAHGRVEKENNDTGGWRDTSTFWMKAQRVIKPMNVIWAGVLLLVIISAARSRGNGRFAATGGVAAETAGATGAAGPAGSASAAGSTGTAGSAGPIGPAGRVAHPYALQRRLEHRPTRVLQRRSHTAGRHPNHDQHHPNHGPHHPNHDQHHPNHDQHHQRREPRHQAALAATDGGNRP